jgi:DNA helicase-2/ATP-dependent DNA helicase PcrA
MDTFNKQYSLLNPEQKKAVDTIDGPVFVQAGPGTGKTQILTLRIANILMKADGILPENILALTFTNAAAHNMRERLSQIIGIHDAYRVYIATFHSFAEDMIKRYPDYFQRFINAKLISPIVQYQILEGLADSHGGEHFSIFKRREGTVGSIASAIGQIKNEGLTIDEYRKSVEDTFEERKEDESMFYKRATADFKKGDMKPHELIRITKKRDKSLALADITEAYEKRLRDEQLYDYNDLINTVVQELKNDSLFQTELQEQFQYILVDEHQDTNDGQNMILTSLIDNPVWEGKPNVFVVGDAKQSIFRFAGASQESFHTLFNRLQDVTTITLQKNYRSQQTILNHAQELIEHSDYHNEDEHLDAFFEHEGSVAYREFHNYKTEALWVAQDIKKRIDSGEEPSEIAVLFRNNTDAQDIRTLLDAYGIPYRDHSKKNLLEDTDMLKIFLYVKLIENFDDEYCGKLLFANFLGFDVLLVQRVLRAYHLQRNYDTLFDMIADEKKLADVIDSPKEQKKYHDFVTTVIDLKQRSVNEDFVTFFSSVLRESGFLNYVLASKDSATGLAKVETLFDEIKKEQMNRESFNLRDFIDYLDTMRKQNIRIPFGIPMSSGVELMTFHSSKGLEYETVYIIRALHKKKRGSEIDLPFKNFSDGDSEDERRLMYVALTRAKKNCYISSHLFNADAKEQTRSLHVGEIASLPHIDMSEWEEEHSADIVDFFSESKAILTSLLDNEYIKERFWTTKLSVSALNNFCESPILYFFRNLIRLPQARSPFLDFGNLIHGTLELFFEASKEKGIILGIDVLEDCLQNCIQQQFIYQEYEEKAHKVLREYYDQYASSFELPLETELRVPGLGFDTTHGDTITLTGVVDKITKNADGQITVWDYKTGRSYSEKDKAGKEKIKRQAVFYKLLLQHAFEGKYNPSRIVFDFVEKNKKKDEFEQMIFEVTQDDIETLQQEINTLIEVIRSGTLLDVDIVNDRTHQEFNELLELMKGPRTYKQPSLID